MGGGALAFTGPLAGIASGLVGAYGTYEANRTERQRINAERAVGIASAEGNSRLLNNVLLGAGALLALMVVKKALK